MCFPIALMRSDVVRPPTSSLPQTPPYSSYTINTSSPQNSGLLRWFPSMAGSGTTIKERVSNTNVTINGIHNSWPAEGSLGFGVALGFDHDPAARIDTGIDLGLTSWSYAIWCLVHTNEAPENTYFFAEANGDGRNLAVHWGFEKWFVWNKMSAGTVNLDTWHHLVYTFDSATGTGTIYDNGAVASGINPLSGITPDVGGRLYLGGFPGYDPGTLDGQIADFRVYDHVLSSSDVSAMYDTATRFDLYKPL